MPGHRINFSMEERQFLDGTMDVTRRLGWTNLRVGQVLVGVVRKDERQVARVPIIVVSVRREPLNAIRVEDCIREGCPEMTPEEFVESFCSTYRCGPETAVTRIEFRRVGPNPKVLGRSGNIET